MNKKILIIPTSTDLNRGDQALVLQTGEVIKEVYKEDIDIYMMSDGESKQCEGFGLKICSDILKHPSRKTHSSKKNIGYSKLIKIQWGLIAIGDYIFSSLLLNKVTRKLMMPFLTKETKHSLKLYEDSDACFVKGGGFLHDYTGGMIGLYTMYYQTYHIRLALAMKKKVYIMPNSYGPFKSKHTKKMLNKLLDRCTLVTARESISASGNTNGLDRDIECYPDLAFFLSQKKESKIKMLQEKFNLDESKNYVAITVRPYRFYQYESPQERYEQYKKTFVDFVAYLRSKNYMPLFVVHTRAINDHENDELCIEEITSMIADKTSYQIIKDDTLDCYDLKEIYSKCRYIIGTRFHSVIFSVEQKIPAIAITYGGNKGDGITKDMNLNEYAIKIGELTFETLKNKFEMLEENEADVVEKIQKYLDFANQKYQELIRKIEKEMKL